MSEKRLIDANAVLESPLRVTGMIGGRHYVEAIPVQVIENAPTVPAVALPFELSDTVYAVALADCKLGNCPEVDTESCLYRADEMPTEDVFRCRAKHALIETVVVEQIDATITEDGIEITINDYWNAKDCHVTIEEADAALGRAE